MIGTDFLEFLEFPVGTGTGNDLRAGRLGKLNGRRSDTAGSAKDHGLFHRL